MQRKTGATRGSDNTQTQAAEKTEHVNPTWGRANYSLSGSIMVLLIFIFCPMLVLYMYVSCMHFDCALSTPFLNVVVHKTMTINQYIALLPSLTAKASMIGVGWLAFQALLAVYLPGPTGYGQLTPAGHVLEYKVNGFNVWILTHVLFIGGSFYLHLFEPTIIYDNWGPLLVFANIYGYCLTLFSYIKAYTFPTHAKDRKFSGNFMYDLFMGIEFNPRIGTLDFKLFHNGRPGIVAWTLINISFAAAQYRNYGYVTHSMIIVNVLHAVYVVDFFYNEDWYLRTIDIAHDHFGFMLAWGDSVWLPWTYTLQGFYLVTHPVELSPVAAGAIWGLGALGYFIFRSVNHQKDYFRTADGKCNIWGKPAEYVDAKFTTSDGKVRSSKLLTSGWWGLSRHFNYVGDLCISLAYCLPCGFTHILPYFYIIYMTLLLVTRARRDDARLTAKYGAYWEEYKKRVPWKICPYIY
jgi:7-dehydrocholesterol reductase